MLEVQNTALGLLCEIDDICRQNGAEYSLCGRTLSAAVRSGGWVNDDCVPEIMMTPDNYLIFAAVAASRPGRVLETPGTNPHLDGIYARYVDPETTLIDIENGISHYERGIYVMIRILRTYKNGSKLDRAVSGIITRNRTRYLKYRYELTSGKERLKVALLMLARLLLCHTAFTGAYFRKNLRDDGESKYYYYDGKKRLSINRKIASKYQDIEFEGKTLRCISGPENYLASEQGKAMKEAIALPIAREAASVVYYDASCPWREFVRQEKECGWDLDEIIRGKTKYDEYYRIKYLRTKTVNDKQFIMVWRSINRMRIWELYHGREQGIIDAYNAGGTQAVRDELAQYTEMVEAYADRNLGFCIDTELFDIVCEILTDDGKGGKAKKARKLMPEEFSESVTDFLSKEGYL